MDGQIDIPKFSWLGVILISYLFMVLEVFSVFLMICFSKETHFLNSVINMM